MDPLGGLEALGQRIAQEQDGVEDAGIEVERAFLRERFLAAVRSARRRRIAWRVFGGFALGAAAAIAIFFVRRASSAALDFSVDGAPGKVGEFLPSPDNRSIELRFNEGTSATFSPRTRGRVSAVSQYGADVVIESGKANMSVVPRAHNRWLVHAGPFVVHVTGTRFEVSWDPVKDRFVLDLYEGKVTISGCVFGEGNPVAAGERVEAGCGLSEIHVSRLAARQDSHEPASDSSAQAATSSGSPEPTSEKAKLDWASMARAGRYAEAFRAAEVEGLPELRARSSATNLLLLGDAGRLSGHDTEAREAYLTVRSRFSGSNSSAIAAFYLGRLDLDAHHGASAKKWLLAYLDELPDGPLSAAALGRLLEIQIAANDRPSALALAKQYLNRYPSGPHSAAAEHVLTDGDSHDRR